MPDLGIRVARHLADTAAIWRYHSGNMEVVPAPHKPRGQPTQEKQADTPRQAGTPSPMGAPGTAPTGP